CGPRCAAGGGGSRCGRRPGGSRRVGVLSPASPASPTSPVHGGGAERSEAEGAALASVTRGGAMRGWRDCFHRLLEHLRVPVGVSHLAGRAGEGHVVERR